MRYLIVVAMLVIACGGGAPATAPSAVATPSAKPTAAPTAKPTPVALTSPDHETCELSIETAGAFEGTLYQIADAIIAEDPDQLQGVIDQTVELSRAIRELAEEETGLAWTHWVAALQAIDDAELDHLTGDDLPFIDAVGDAAIMKAELVAACS